MDALDEADDDREVLADVWLAELDAEEEPELLALVEAEEDAEVLAELEAEVAPGTVALVDAELDAVELLDVLADV